MSTRQSPHGGLNEYSSPPVRRLQSHSMHRTEHCSGPLRAHCLIGIGLGGWVFGGVRGYASAPLPSIRDITNVPFFLWLGLLLRTFGMTQMKQACPIYPPPPPLYKLRPCPSYSRGFIIVVDTGGGFIFVSEVPVSSTQFLLRVGRAT